MHSALVVLELEGEGVSEAEGRICRLCSIGHFRRHESRGFTAKGKKVSEGQPWRRLLSHSTQNQTTKEKLNPLYLFFPIADSEMPRLLVMLFLWKIDWPSVG